MAKLDENKIEELSDSIAIVISSCSDKYLTLSSTRVISNSTLLKALSNNNCELVSEGDYRGSGYSFTFKNNLFNNNQ